MERGKEEWRAGGLLCMSNDGHIEKMHLEKRIVEKRNKQEMALGSCRQLRASHLSRKLTLRAVCCLDPV